MGAFANANRLPWCPEVGTSLNATSTAKGQRHAHETARYANPQAHLQTFRQFLAPFPLLDLNEPIMERFAEIRSYLRRRGELISDFDLLIGATTLSYDLTLLTYNKRHFTRIPDLMSFIG